jgi:hypothetical protein
MVLSRAAGDKSPETLGGRSPSSRLGLDANLVNGRIPNHPAGARALDGPVLPTTEEVLYVKNCRMCKFSRLCNDLPGVCVLIPYVAVALVTVAIGYLFVTQELL